MASQESVMTDKSANRDLPIKKTSMKVPKKMHKAEREKLKRDQLNELFMDLYDALEPDTRQNNGKASILCDASRLLRDLLTQVDSLKKERASLLTESHYVTVEKNELEDETALLRAEVEKLRDDVKRRMQSGPTWSSQADVTVTQLQLPNAAVLCPEDSPRLPPSDPALHPSPVIAPLIMFPLCHELQAHQNPEEMTSFPSSVVKKPHARYPTPADSWPLQLLAKQPRDEEEGWQSPNAGTPVSKDVGSDHVPASTVENLHSIG